MQIVEHSVELLVPSDAIPDSIEASVANLDIGSSVHLLDVTLPPGAKIHRPRQHYPRHRRAAVGHEGRGRDAGGRGRGGHPRGRAGGGAREVLTGRTGLVADLSAPAARPERFLAASW